MQVKIFAIPAYGNTDVVDELNRFLRSVKILEIKKVFVEGEGNLFWSMCITYLPLEKNYTDGLFNKSNKEKIDYKNTLSESEFARFSLLRKIRKQLAEKDAVPAFAVFTDAELAEISRFDEVLPERIQKVSGIGQKKMEKYGIELCRL